MKLTLILFLLIPLMGCNSSGEQKTATDSETTETTSDVEDTTDEKDDIPPPPPPKYYANDRFKEVWVERLGEHTFRIQGQARVFEATVNWIVEDGHVELKEGFVTADQGGPEWGAFDFTIEVEKLRTHSTLTLYLFELSAKDGSRQGELPIPLY